MASYQKMLDSAFAAYYTRFQELDALTKENAVTREELFPYGESAIDRDRMHKMLSMNIVKRVGANRYWLDEKRAADGNGVLKQRFLLLIVAGIIAVMLAILSKIGILNL